MQSLTGCFPRSNIVLRCFLFCYVGHVETIAKHGRGSETVQ